MRDAGRTARLAVVVVALGCVLGTAAPPSGAGETRERSARSGRTWVFAFEADTLGRPPASTRISGGRWEVLEDSTSRVLRQGESDDGIAFHTLQFLKPLLENQEVSVRFRIREGEMDPSAGIAFQLDAKGRNGYLVRVSGKNREVIAHYLLAGKRRDLRFAPIDPPEAGTWHTLAVRRVGEVIEVRYDGALAMKIRDERFRRGNVGLWTEDDTVADFAELTVRAL